MAELNISGAKESHLYQTYIQFSSLQLFLFSFPLPSFSFPQLFPISFLLLSVSFLLPFVFSFLQLFLFSVLQEFSYSFLQPFPGLFPFSLPFSFRALISVLPPLDPYHRHFQKCQNQEKVINQSYGNTGCGVIKRGYKIRKIFCVRINIPQGNY